MNSTYDVNNKEDKDMANLYMVMLGGRHTRANVEVHDVMITAGDSLESTYPQLKTAWFGDQKGLHIDAWSQINSVEGAEVSYQIELKDHKPEAKQDKLYLINLGGYDKSEFGELHRYILVAAPTQAKAKQIGKNYILKSWMKPHTDRVVDVDDCILIENVNEQYVHLNGGKYTTNEWENCYILI